MFGRLTEAVPSRSAASVAVAFLGIRRASEVAHSSLNEVRMDPDSGVVDIKVNRRENDQLGLGQLSHSLVVPPGGRPVPSACRPVGCGPVRGS